MKTRIFSWAIKSFPAFVFPLLLVFLRVTLRTLRFMHLFLFCGLHEAIQIKEAPFVPSYLIIDQPSRPYWGDPNAPKLKLDHSDELNIRRAFELLNWTIDRIVNKQKGQCQLIVFEHVPPSTWAGLDDVHLVEEFIDGNALIPESWLLSEIERN